jgi:hypothetical protein
MKENLKQLNQGDLKELRAQLHNEQNEICPVLKKKFPIDKMVIDHKHTTSQQTVGKDSNGLVRGCIHFQAISFVRNTFLITPIILPQIAMPE